MGPVTDRVLVVDDDRAIREALARALQLEGYAVVAATDGAAALEAVRADGPTSLVLDVMMPQIDGLTVCASFVPSGDLTPVLMLTARPRPSDRVAGLDAGADDYLAKPFELDELLARLRALLRRARPVDDGPATARCRSPTWRRPGDPPGAGEASDEIELTKTEFDLLELLMRNHGIVLDHATIYERIWGYDFGPDSKNLAVYISYLRRKVDNERTSQAHPHRARRGLLGPRVSRVPAVASQP